VAARAEAEATRVAATKIAAGTRGNAMHRRGRTIVTIAERAAVLGYFADCEEITALLQTMAERGVRAGVTVPGVTVAHDSSAT